MRIIVLFSFLALCSAELGYQYQQNNPAYSYESETSFGNYQITDHYEDHADFHKHFYSFEAPYDSSEEAELVEHKLAALKQKNLQVVFIKAPENKAVAGALNALAKQTSEDKTAIYVLNKQTDSNELASKLSALQAQHKHKPQVHFVKYRTDAEAAQAQQHIQAQYGKAAAQTLQPLQRPSLGYSQQTELSEQQLSLGYSQQSELPEQQPSLEYLQQRELPEQSYSPNQQSSTAQTYIPEESFQPTPQPSPQSNYVQPLPSYAGMFQGYNYGANEGHVDLPPLPLPQQQLAPSPYDLDARTARSQKIDFRVNERHRTNSRMVFPTETRSKTYLPAISNTYLPPQKRRRRAHF